MNIAILGAGIVGVTTAYALATDGHQVTVFDVAPGLLSPRSAEQLRAEAL